MSNSEPTLSKLLCWVDLGTKSKRILVSYECVEPLDAYHGFPGLSLSDGIFTGMDTVLVLRRIRVWQMYSISI